MKFDKSEFESLVQENRQKSSKVNPEHLNMLQQASVAHEHLVQDSNWAIFQQQLQHWVELTQHSKDQFSAIMESPDVHNPEYLAQVRTYMLLCAHRIEMLEAIIALPKQIIESGEEAKLVLAEIGKQSMQENNENI